MYEKCVRFFGTLIIVSICYFLVSVETGLFDELNNNIHVDEKPKKCLGVESNTQTSASDGKNRILIISPLGRAGSSWIGEMLSNIDENTYYVYEPISGYSQNNIGKVTASVSQDLLSDIFSCKLPEWMVHPIYKWSRALTIFRRKCGKDCKTLKDFNNRCKSATTFIIKDIRTSLSTTRDILSMPSMKGLKVVYLVRDPRAQIFSRLNTFGSESKSWVINITLDCDTLNHGVEFFQDLSQMFPGQLYFLRYEDMCLNPSAETDQLWRFLKIGNHQNKTPSTLLEYIKVHSGTSSRHPYSLHRNGTTEWNSWRTEISNSNFDFVDIEKKCKKAMRYSGYTFLNEKKNIDNMKIDTLTDHNLNNCE